MQSYAFLTPAEGSLGWPVSLPGDGRLHFITRGSSRDFSLDDVVNEQYCVAELLNGLNTETILCLVSYPE
jgi:hypothetical protein